MKPADYYYTTAVRISDEGVPSTQAVPNRRAAVMAHTEEIIVWDSYVDWSKEADGYALQILQDPTSFRIVNQTTGECFNSFLMFVASYDVTNRGQGPWADYMYCGTEELHHP